MSQMLMAIFVAYSTSGVTSGKKFRRELKMFENNYPVTYSFMGVLLDLRRKNITWILIRNWRIESTDILLKLGKDCISSHIE